MKLVVGLTGGISTGKTTVANKISLLGYDVIDCDLISHDIMNNPECKERIINEFGNVLDGKDIDRKKLGNIVFYNKDKKEKLESILHPIIFEETKRQIENSNKELVFINCPLLYETNFISLCDKVIVVYCNLDTQLNRLMKRDKISKEEAENKVKNQMNLNEKAKLADFVIDNNFGIEELDAQIRNIIERMM